MTHYATKPLGFWQLLKKCFTGYGTIYKNTWQIVLLMAIFNFIASAATTSQRVVVIIAALVLLLLRALFNAMMLYQGDAALAGKPKAMGASLAIAAKRYFPFLIAYVVITFLIFLMLLFVVMATFTAGPGLAALSTYLNTPIAQLPAWWSAVFLIFVIICAILIVFLYFAPALIITKDRGIFAAFKESADLVKDHWWRIFGVLLMIVILFVIVFSILGIIFPSSQALMLGLRSFVFQLLMFPLPIAATLTLLKDLQLRAGTTITRTRKKK